ncbi:MAG: hypothetical protein EOO67_13140, partial [Microbacterium sp.]
LESTEHVVVIVIHHISADGGSMAPLARDLLTAYSARMAGGQPGWTPLPVQFADFALWQREVLGSEDDSTSPASKQLEYWKDTLADLPTLLDLPLDRQRTPHRSPQGARVEFEIDAEQKAALAEVARRHNATVFMVVHAAFAVLLSRMSGTEDIALGTPVGGRGDAALDDLVGMFVNTLVLRTKVAQSATFGDVLESARETDLGAFEHTDVPFERLVEALAPVRSNTYAPLVQVMLTFQNNETARLELPGLTVTALDSEATLAKFDLTLAIDEQGAEAQGPTRAVLTYAADIFDEATVAKYADRFQRILDAVVADSSVVVGDIDILSADEHAELDIHIESEAPVASLGSHSVAEELAAKPLPELLDAAASINPDGIALSHNGIDVTYRQWHEKSGELAKTLASVGVGPEAAVTVALSTLLPGLLEGASGEGFADQFAGMLAGVIAEATSASDGRVNALPVDLIECWHEQVSLDPETLALAGNGSRLSRRELNTRANQVAHELVARGVRPDDVVALVVPRSIEWIVGMLATWKAGAAYAPIDPAYPAERIAAMVED